MGRVLTNDVTLSVGRQPDIGSDATSFEQLEINTISNYGATITTVRREPISPDRQARKGTTSDLDSNVEFETDTTLSAIDTFMDGFVAAIAVNSEMTFNPGAVTSSGYVIPAASAQQAGKLQYTANGPQSLVYARRFTTAANNGLKVLSANVATSDTSIEVAGLTAEASTPGNASVELAGIRAGDAGDLSLTVSSGAGTLTSGNGSSNSVDFTTLGLTVGQRIHIGGLTATNQFDSGAGTVRLLSIEANTLTFDQASSDLATDPGTGKNIDLLFGRFIRNVRTDSPEFLEQYYMFEASLPTLGAGNTPRYQYSLDNLCNTLAINMPLTDKSTVTFAFIGTDTENPTPTRRPGASMATLPSKTTSLNTSQDIARLAIPGIDDNGDDTCFKSLTLNINNNVSPEKCLGTLGARFMNYGNFQVSAEAQLLFTNEEVVSAIRNNQTVGLSVILDNDDGALALDIPSMTIGGGDREYPVNESVLINFTGEAFRDNVFGTSIAVSLFPVYPQ